MADRVLKNVSVGSSLCDIVIKSGRIAFVGKSGLPGEDMAALRRSPGLSTFTLTVRSGTT